MRAKGVIFDLDGVLLDSVPAHFDAWRHAFDAYGYGFDHDAYRSHVDGRLARDGARAVMTGATDGDIDGAVELKERLYRARVDDGQFEVFPDAREAVERLYRQGIPMAVASSSPVAAHILDLADLTSRFAVIVGGDDVTRGKPAPDAFLLAATHLALPPRDCLVIEDSVAGLAAARAGGFKAIGVRRPPETGPGLDADRTIASLKELESCL